MPKKIAVLGSTGSIGRQTLEVIDSLGPEYRVVALTAHRRLDVLLEQVRRYKPELAVLSDPDSDLRAAALKLSAVGQCAFETGREGLIRAATSPAADLVVIALVGFSGFEPTWEALRAGKKVALANKESLVVGGELLAGAGKEPLLKQIIPIDSEHSAIWQCMQGVEKEQVERIWLTASGGPFLNRDRRQLEKVSVEEALSHPNWNMGPKITVDSATLMNKGFEVLEAHWLFGLELSRIRVVIHPQSAVHSLVELIDGSLLAQIGPADMRLPIQYALTFPRRSAAPWPRLNLFGESWSFQEPDERNFPCLNLAYRAGEIGGTMPACLNAANEIAVDQFRRGKIKLTMIPELIAAVMERHKVKPDPEAGDLIDADRWARQEAKDRLASWKGNGH